MLYYGLCAMPSKKIYIALSVIRICAIIKTCYFCLRRRSDHSKRLIWKSDRLHFGIILGIIVGGESVFRGMEKPSLLQSPANFDIMLQVYYENVIFEIWWLINEKAFA